MRRYHLLWGHQVPSPVRGKEDKHEGLHAHKCCDGTYDMLVM